MTSNATLGTMATPRVEVSVRQWLTTEIKSVRKKEREGSDTRRESWNNLTRWITDDQALPCERNGSEADTSKQSTTVSPCATENTIKSNIMQRSRDSSALKYTTVKAHTFTTQTLPDINI